MKRYYVAYGSNLNIGQMKYRCPGARVVGTSVIENYELLFKGSQTGAYLTIEPKEGESVPVAIWETTEEDEEALDRYEGFPTFYYKKELELIVKSSKKNVSRKRTAYVYIMHEDRKLGSPSWHYIETCLAGYRAFRFDKNKLFRAIRRSGGVLDET